MKCTRPKVWRAGQHHNLVANGNAEEWYHNDDEVVKLTDCISTHHCPVKLQFLGEQSSFQWLYHVPCACHVMHYYRIQHRHQHVFCALMPTTAWLIIMVINNTSYHLIGDYNDAVTARASQMQHAIGGQLNCTKSPATQIDVSRSR